MKFSAYITAAALSALLLTTGVSAEAKAVVLAERETGAVLYSENADERLPMASVTKIMTLLLAAEQIEAGRLSFEDMIPTSAYASGMTGSVIWLEPNEQMSAGELLKSVVIASANDSCVALAEYITGSEEKFVALMNARAAELGMTNTHFVNCVGYDAENHYTTAADVAKMAAELRRHDCYDTFLSTRLDSVRTGTERETQLLNTNKLMTKYNGMTGLKTGTTDGAGYCFAGTAKRGDMELIAVVLGCDDTDERFTRAAELLDYGFDNYCLFTPSFDMERLADIPVKNGVKRAVSVAFGSSMPCVIPKGTQSQVEYFYSVSDVAAAPIAVGDTLGTVTAVLDGKVIIRAELTAAENVEEMTFFKSLSLLLGALFG